MRRIPHLSLALFVLVTICFLVFQITYVETNKKWEESIDKMISTEGSRVTEPLYELVDTVKENSVYSGSDDALSLGIMKGYVDALPDRFAMFMDEKNFADYLSYSGMDTGFGIGVTTIYDETRDGLYVVSVDMGSSAEQNGVVPGDLITNVGDSHVSTLGYFSSVKELYSGKANDEIKVTVKKRDGTNRVLTLVKKQITNENIVGEKLNDRIGLITVREFGAGDDEKFKTVLENLIKSGREKFIIDIRNNPGGNIETIARMLDFILAEGPMFSISDKSGAANTMTSDVNSMPYPIAVIVNENTVCGAEVFAACMQSFENCRLIGETTYGKASEQSVVELSDGGAVYLSTKKYTPMGSEDFDGIGVKPQVETVMSDEMKMKFTTLTSQEDIQLQSAIEYLLTKEKADVLD